MKDKKKKNNAKLRKPPKLDFESLQPAIVDGKLLASKDELMVLKRARDYELLTLVKVTKTYEDGTIILWDETLGQSFMFNVITDVALHDRLKIYDKTISKSVFRQKIVDDVSMNGEAEAGPSLDDE